MSSWPKTTADRTAKNAIHNVTFFAGDISSLEALTLPN